MHELSFTLN